MCTYAWVYSCKWKCLWSLEEGIGSLGTVGIGSLELSSVTVGNWTWKSKTFPSPQCHLSWPKGILSLSLFFSKLLCSVKAVSQVAQTDLELTLTLKPWSSCLLFQSAGIGAPYHRMCKLQFLFFHVRCWLAPKNSLFLYCHRFDFKNNTMHNLDCTWCGFELHWDPHIVPLRTRWLQRPSGSNDSLISSKVMWLGERSKVFPPS